VTHLLRAESSSSLLRLTRVFTAYSSCRATAEQRADFAFPTPGLQYQRSQKPFISRVGDRGVAPCVRTQARLEAGPAGVRSAACATAPVPPGCQERSKVACFCGKPVSHSFTAPRLVLRLAAWARTSMRQNLWTTTIGKANPRSVLRPAGCQPGLRRRRKWM